MAPKPIPGGALLTCIQLWRFTRCRSTGTRPINIASPRIRPVSAMMEPTELPSASPGTPRTAASTLTAASGRVVPTLTTVAPMSIFGTPRRRDSDTACSTRMSAPFASTASDTAMTTSRPISGASAAIPESQASRVFASTECGSLMCVPYQQPAPNAKPRKQPNVGSPLGRRSRALPCRKRGEPPLGPPLPSSRMVSVP